MIRRLQSLPTADAESAASIAEAAAASRLAEILVVGFERCELEDRPLSELQKIDVLATALIGFSGFREGVERHVELHGELTRLATDSSSEFAERRTLRRRRAAERRSSGESVRWESHGGLSGSSG